MHTDNPLPPSLHFYSVLVIGLCEGPLFVVLQVKEAPSSCTNSRSGSKPDWVCMGLGGGLEEEGGVFNRQDAACAWAPEHQHLPCFTQGLISRSAVSLMLRESSTSAPHQLMSLLLLMWLLLCVLQSFWGPYQWSSTRRRKVRTWDVACWLFSHWGQRELRNGL